MIVQPCNLHDSGLIQFDLKSHRGQRIDLIHSIDAKKYVWFLDLSIWSVCTICIDMSHKFTDYHQRSDLFY